MKKKLLLLSWIPTLALLTTSCIETKQPNHEPKSEDDNKKENNDNTNTDSINSNKKSENQEPIPLPLPTPKQPEISKEQSSPENPLNPHSKKDNSAPQIPQFPIIPPNFPGLQKPKPAINKPELEIKQTEAYRKILDRSFAISFNTITQSLDDGKRDKDEIPFLSTGTGWILDYAWKNGVENSEELMLYIATNAHVYQYAYNALDNKLKETFPEYFTSEEQKDARVVSFGIGIPLGDANLEPIESGKHEGNENIVSYFINSNDQKYKNGVRDVKLVGDQIFSNPKTVFVATDFFDKKTNEEILKKHPNYQPNINKTQRIGKDFAVFAIKIKFNELKKQAETNQDLKKLLEHINKGINSINNDVTLFSSKQYPNHDKSKVPYIAYDYYSAYLHKEQYKNFDSENEILSPNAKRIYIAGFPSDNDSGNNQYFWKNYPKNIKIEDYTFTSKSFLSSAPVENLLSEKTISYGIGVQAQVLNSSLYYGASGSLAVNEFGMPVGIYSSLSALTPNIKDTTKWGAFTFLVQNSNDLFYGPKHNLIDGSNKELYPNQEKSFRQNLKILSEQDDFFKSFNKTVLFENGV
ncbi:MIP family Ig-specific serine endopeptidase [Mycoplasma sp. 1781]